MSGIAGIYDLRGEPVDPALVRRMADAAAHRGPDGSGYWSKGPIGLGHRMLHSTPESLAETQPFSSEAGDLVLVLDGRIDNRAELRAELVAAGMRLRDDTDAELVLRAYEKWGPACPAQIIGDFAFAIWDGRLRLLFCCRDPLGVKPLYYQADGRRFRFGSELRQILEDTRISPEPNEGMIGEYLSREITDREETLYRGILRLPPAHFLIVRPDRLTVTRYWDIDGGRAVRHRTDAEYAEHFHAVFSEAVRCRLRASGPVGAELSGGLDSSSVVATVASLHRSGGVTDEGFETFSLVFPGLACDESDYASEVVKLQALKSNTAPASRYGLDWWQEHTRRARDFPEYPTCAMSDSLKSIAHDHGVRVLLTGYGGDDWLTGSPYSYADLLRRFRVAAFVRQVRWDYQAELIERRLFSVLNYGVWPLIPRSGRRLAKLAWSPSRVPDWLEPGFAARIALRDRLRRAAGPQPGPTFAQNDLRRQLAGGWHAHGMEMLDRSAARSGLELRHPFHDRRIVEFALALPEDQRRRKDRSKLVLREAMRGRLPEGVRARRGKADFSHVFAEVLGTADVRPFFEAPVMASLGWLRRDHARRTYELMVSAYAAGDATYTAYVRRLWMQFGIEIWLKSAFDSGSKHQGGG